jgi:hypothetical protein
VLLGQTSASARLNPGARVRVTLAQEKPRTAVVVGQRADTLLVRWFDAADTTAVPLARMSALEVSTGHHRSVLKSAGMGADRRHCGRARGNRDIQSVRGLGVPHAARGS